MLQPQLIIHTDAGIDFGLARKLGHTVVLKRVPLESKGEGGPVDYWAQLDCVPDVVAPFVERFAAQFDAPAAA